MVDNLDQEYFMDLKTLIISILNEKKIKNKSYSLRALARDLSLDPGQIHRIMSSKMKPTPLVAYRVGKFINLKCEDLIRLIETTLKK